MMILTLILTVMDLLLHLAILHLTILHLVLALTVRKLWHERSL